MKIVAVFGAGVSLAAGLPSTKELTTKICTGNSVFRAGNGSYHEIADANLPTSSTRIDPEIITLIRHVAERSKDFFLTRREVNYEDIAYVISQLAEGYENPGIIALTDEISQKMFPGNELTARRFMLNPIAFRAETYIHKYITYLLDVRIGDTKHLGILKELYDDPEVETIDIFSYNHDLVLEKFFDENGIYAIDGFSTPQDNVRLFDMNLFKIPNAKLKLYKLHGGINWHEFYFYKKESPKRQNLIGSKLGIPANSNYYFQEEVEFEGERCIRDTFLESSPAILVGTDNKLFDYQRETFLLLQSFFYETLAAADKIIISGTSFSDRGLRTRMSDILMRSRGKETFLVDPCIDNIIKNTNQFLVNKMILRTNTIGEVSWFNGTVGRKLQ